MEFNRCFGCMEQKTGHPICEHCGWDERQQNLPHQLPIGTILRGQYLVGRVLGQGGFGITYLGWDAYLDVPVAIKEYFPAHTVTRDCSATNCVTSYTGSAEQQYAENKNRFMREAKALAKFAKLQHIVKIHGFFPENNTVYMVMEYVRGKTLLQTLRDRGPMTLSQTLEILEPVMEDLQKVHEAGTVHRDISPDNIILDPEEGPKLLDFGAVREVQNADQNMPLSSSTEAILKQGFAPAEQYNARGALGPWTDVYALCATICFCLNGKVPMSAPDRAIDLNPDDFLDRLPGLNPAQREALRHGMALRPAERTASVEELLRELRAAQSDKPRKPAAAPERLKTAASEVPEEKAAQPERTSDRTQNSAYDKYEISRQKARKTREKKAKRSYVLFALATAAVCLLLFYVLGNNTAGMDNNGYEEVAYEDMTNSELESLAEDDDIGAQLELAWRYDAGEQLQEDDQQAAYWYQRAADQGDAWGQALLGYCYEYGIGVPQNDQTAFVFYQAAADQGNPMGMSGLATCYGNGQGVALDYDQCYEWMEKAAELGDLRGLNGLGICYLYGQGVAQSDEQAAECFRLAADGQYALAQSNLGACYEHGVGVERDAEEAVLWYQMAADQGDISGCNNLGYCYLNGVGVDEDLQMAAEMFAASAGQGDPTGQSMLGWFYYYGKAVNQDPDRAVELFSAAADAGNADAMFRLGVCCEEGQGMEQNMEAAALWYQSAADQGDDRAQYNLASMYLEGRGVEKDIEKARELLEDSAAAGNEYSQDLLKDWRFQ